MLLLRLLNDIQWLFLVKRSRKNMYLRQIEGRALSWCKRYFSPQKFILWVVFCFANRQKSQLGSVRFCIVPKVGGKTLKGISESDVIWAVWATKSLICWRSVFQLERAVQAFPSALKNFIPVFIVTYLLWLCSPTRRKYEKWKFDGMFSLRRE